MFYPVPKEQHPQNILAYSVFYPITSYKSVAENIF
jgi:hypothetical protein